MLGGWVLLWHLGVFSSFGLDVVLPFGLGQYSLFSPLNLSFIIFFFHSFGSSGHFVGVGSHTEGRLTHREAVHAPCEDVWLGLFLETRALLWSSTAVPTAPSPCHGEGQTLSRRSCLSGAIPRVPPCSRQLG